MLRLLAVMFFSFSLSLALNAQEIWMQPNEGQWDERIEFKVDLQMGEFLIENGGFTYFLNNSKQKFNHSDVNNKTSVMNEEFQAHVIRSKFLGSSWEGESIKTNPSKFYKNYLLGNNKSNWKSKVYNYSTVVMKDFYPSIDLRLDGSQGEFKYSFELAPGIDPQQISIEFNGQDRIQIDPTGKIILGNRFGEVIEGRPHAWTINENKKTEVTIEYINLNNTIQFAFPEGYNESDSLVIDPSLTFSTFTGSTADNWGMTATPDLAGNLFGGGVVFGNGIYPLTVGAYDITFSGGVVDVGITKFSADGTNALYSTLIGGAGSETPNSLVSADNGELFIFGLTSSIDFPMAGSSFDNSFNGGPNVAANANGLGFSGGTDLYIARLSADGTSLIASTYVGGSDNDGMNTSNLKYNYGDQFRGEIILDGNGFVYVTSMTQSSDFPTINATQPTMSGTQDAILFKISDGLSTMDWSSYYGGDGFETGNSIQLSSAGNVYIAGGTNSSNLPIITGFDANYDGGLCDGYVARFDGVTGSVMSGTYIGLSEYDQTYFVQLDADDNVYVLGQTESDLGITPGLYGNPNSGQFINKYNETLSSQLWKTMIGASTGHVEISPTAFLVSECYDIYLSGWGGTLNQNASVSQALFSTTNGFPLTSDAYQATTNGSNFYLAVLGQDAGSLKYGSFMGGSTSSPDHVDGGTSRFDKDGTVYHAVCAACGGDPNGFTSTPGVYSETNNSTNCNLAAFKFDLKKIEAAISDPAALVCLPDPVIFINNSLNGNGYFWDFGDGTSSIQTNPTHLYPGPGVYNGSLVAYDDNGCFSSDTVFFQVNIGDFQGAVVIPTQPICPGETYQLEASGGTFYSWTPAADLDDPTIATPTASIEQTTTFTVVVSDSCGVDTLQVTLEVAIPQYSISPDTAVCLGANTTIFATGGGTYLWTPSTFLNNNLISNPISTPDTTITYHVEITSVDGCIYNDSIIIDVFSNPPAPIIADTVFLCLGASSSITVGGADSYSWSPNNNITSTTGAIVSVNPTTDMYYFVDFTNTCGTATDSVFIKILEASILAEYDTIICFGESASLHVSGAQSYIWSPESTLNSIVGEDVIATPNAPTNYSVIGTDINGCVAYDSVFVDLFPIPNLNAGSNAFAIQGELVQLNATSNTEGTFTWDPAEFLSCINCTNPIANPDQEFLYTVYYTDINGCSASDTVRVFYDPILYVPNTFTPDGNEFNSVFKAIAGNINSFNLNIYNRWGEILFTSNDINIGWDGTYNGSLAQDGTYIWKILITNLSLKEELFVGHINLLR